MRRFSVSKTVLLIICLMYLILYVDRVNISMAAPLIKADLGLSNTQLGLAFSAFAYPYAVFQLIGGYIGDRLGARFTLCVSGLIVCAATAATGAVGGLASLFAARLALGIGEGAAFPTATRAMAVWVPERSWGFAQGITHSFARIGNAANPISSNGRRPQSSARVPTDGDSSATTSCGTTIQAAISTVAHWLERMVTTLPINGSMAPLAR